MQAPEIGNPENQFSQLEHNLINSNRKASSLCNISHLKTVYTVHFLQYLLLLCRIFHSIVIASLDQLSVSARRQCLLVQMWHIC